jgi:hypothetical protein
VIFFTFYLRFLFLMQSPAGRTKHHLGEARRSPPSPSLLPPPACVVGQSPGGTGGGGIFFPRVLGERVGAVRPGGGAARWQISAR